MASFSEILSQKRKERDLTLEIIAKDLHIKKEHLEALENSDWKSLPEPAFVQGFIKNYSEYLGLDPKYILALYRREFDPKKHATLSNVAGKNPKFRLTPARIATVSFLIIVSAFVFYLFTQYRSVLSSPDLVINSPQDNITTTVSIILISGKTESGTTVSINGDFAPVDQNGNFSKEIELQEGQNIIEVVAAKSVLPKTKKTLTIRLSP